MFVISLYLSHRKKMYIVDCYVSRVRIVLYFNRTAFISQFVLNKKTACQYIVAYIAQIITKFSVHTMTDSRLLLGNIIYYSTNQQRNICTEMLISLLGITCCAHLHYSLNRFLIEQSMYFFQIDELTNKVGMRNIEAEFLYPELVFDKLF